MVFVKIWKWLKLLNSVPFMKKTLVNHVYIGIWSSWLTFTFLQWMNTNFKISQIIFTVQFDHFGWHSQLYCEWKKNFKISQFEDSGQNWKLTKTSSFCSIHQENSCKWCLHSNLIILSDFHSFTVNEEKLQN